MGYGFSLARLQMLTSVSSSSDKFYFAHLSCELLIVLYLNLPQLFG